MDIRRALDDLLDCQPYRQDYYDAIVEAYEKAVEERDKLKAAWDKEMRHQSVELDEY